VVSEVREFYLLSYGCEHERQDENGYAGYCAASKSGECCHGNDNCPKFRPVTFAELRERDMEEYERIKRYAEEQLRDSESFDSDSDVYTWTGGECDLAAER
jgi:hypothetical protein